MSIDGITNIIVVFLLRCLQYHIIFIKHFRCHYRTEIFVHFCVNFVLFQRCVCFRFFPR
uniref:Uncharacterized protein n=1 Tax=Arundo donax TaxID=35708 RepID=A0A0A9HAM5_ARUDO